MTTEDAIDRMIAAKKLCKPENRKNIGVSWCADAIQLEEEPDV